MAFSRIFVRRPRYFGTSLGQFQFDAVLSETTSTSVAITRNPIESGASVTDHSYIVPRTYSVTGVVTDSPNGLQALSQLFNSTEKTRSDAAYEQLLKIQEAREPITVQTGRKLLKNMMVENLSMPQSAATENMAQFTMNLVEVIIFETETISIPADTLEEGQVRESGTSSVSKGRIQPEEVSSSIAVDLFNKFFQ